MNFALKEFLAVKSHPLIYQGTREKLEGQIAGISIDSRTIQPGEVYFALRGDAHDGHDFIREAFDKQACAAVVEPSWWLRNKASYKKHAVFVVDDSLDLLQETARLYREKFKSPVIAITGTNGKTTAKEMMAAVLANLGETIKTEGNLNNHIGLPLTLLQIHGIPSAVVIEMGMNHPGEIARLCEIAQPDHGLITNIGHGHLEFLKTLAGVAKAKMELFDYLSASGVAFVNLDDPLIVKHAPELARAITYGASSEADVSGKLETIDELGRPTLRIENTKIRINSVGSHNTSNALAAIAVGMEFGVSLDKMKVALENLELPGKRMEVIKQNKLVILNDTYNANPESTLAALQALKAFPSEGKKVFVFGDMLELGDHAQAEHAKIGKSVANQGIDAFFAVGTMAAESVAEAQKNSSKLEARHFDSKHELAAALTNLAAESATILVKGSRGMKMEEIVAALLKT